jgi:RNA polymerase sigma-70 factor (ECF subfamily)
MTDRVQSAAAKEAAMGPAALRELASRLYGQSGAAALEFSQQAFEKALNDIAARYLGPDASDASVRQLWESLKCEELVLARACAAGNERAWELFLLRYREKLYGAALAIAGNDTTARELADGLYADLFGTTVRDGVRLSKLASYTGRGSLEGWLRTVLAQEFVNRYRTGKRLVSLEAESEQGTQFVAPQPAPDPIPDPRLTTAIDECLESLPPEDRYVLSAYYLDQRTLADIGRTLRVHESTISRKLEKLTFGLRAAIVKRLVRAGMDRRQAEEALVTDVRDVGTNVRERLTQDLPSPPFLSRSKDRT